MPLTDLLGEEEKLQSAELKSLSYSDTQLKRVFRITESRLDEFKLYIVNCVHASTALQEGHDISSAGFRSLVHIHFKKIKGTFPDICVSSKRDASVHCDYWEWVVKSLIREEKLRRLSLRKVTSGGELDIPKVQLSDVQWERKTIHLYDATGQKPLVSTENFRDMSSYHESTERSGIRFQENGWGCVRSWVRRLGFGQRPLLYHYHDIDSSEVHPHDALCFVADTDSFDKICRVHLSQAHHIAFLITTAEHLQSYLLSRAATLSVGAVPVQHPREQLQCISPVELPGERHPQILTLGKQEPTTSTNMKAADDVRNLDESSRQKLTLHDEVIELREQVRDLQEKDIEKTAEITMLREENELLRALLRKKGTALLLTRQPE
ncbi:hypothetical protein LTR05_000284 [Lithohypha guttulata]|uniref:Uncharacterized protein n=1 Tax=Lithohypha guttulata TaxID=1690604 RepID=A0AAN7T5Z2_9EURO|nr:hypothetical protein LTR05_000284 [Lithohypha guttulata]